VPNTKFTWTDPTTNVDGSPIVAGEITGYSIGIGTASGNYPIQVPVPGPAAASELLSQITPALVPGTYFAAVQAIGPVDSVFSNEVSFVIAAAQPNPPTNFTVA
jgi:hypothetical protein